MGDELQPEVDVLQTWAMILTNNVCVLRHTRVK